MLRLPKKMAQYNQTRNRTPQTQTSSYFLLGKVVPVVKYYAMKTYGGSGYRDPCFLDLGTSWR
jgi:hypothetical protein